MRKVATLWLMLLLASRALAQPDPAVSVTRAAGADDCPDTAALLARIELLRGRPDAGAAVQYQVSFARENAGFRAEIRAGGAAGGARVLHDQAITCAGLEQATAVTLALLLDSDARASTTPTPPPAAKPDVVSRNAAPPPAAAELEFAEQLQRYFQGARRSATLTLGPAGLAGVLRPIAPALRAELGTRMAALRGGLGLLWSPGLETMLAPGTVHVSLWAGTSRSCFAPVLGSALRFDLCAAFYIGALEASAEGYDQTRDATRLWVASSFELALASTPAPIGWELSAAALIPLRRQDFSIDRAGVAYASLPVGLLVSMSAVGLWEW